MTLPFIIIFPLQVSPGSYVLHSTNLCLSIQHDPATFPTSSASTLLPVKTEKRLISQNTVYPCLLIFPRSSIAFPHQGFRNSSYILRYFALPAFPFIHLLDSYSRLLSLISSVSHMPIHLSSASISTLLSKFFISLRDATFAPSGI